MARRQRGFTLIELAVVIAVVAIMIAVFASTAATFMNAKRVGTTRDVLRGLDRALVQFVMQTQRLPCPADGTLASSNAAAGLEQRDPITGDCLNSEQRGVVPWASLGLSEDAATDPYGARITYRVALGLTRGSPPNGAMNFSSCDPAAFRSPPSFTAVGTAPYQSCIRACVPPATTGCCSADNVGTSCTLLSDALLSRGLEVRQPDATGSYTCATCVVAGPNQSPATGVAYILVSHGENRSSGYTAAGVLQEAVGTVGTGETLNAANQPLAAYYADTDINGTATSAHFDDAVSRPTIASVAIAAGLGQRAH